MGRTAWKDEYYVQIYDLIRAGSSIPVIAEIIGVNALTIRAWIKGKPALAAAVKEAKEAKEGKTTATFSNYIYGRLSSKLQRLWDELEAYEHEDNPQKKIELLLQNYGKRIRQKLFLHALFASNFAISEASRRVNVSRKTFDYWINEDSEFRDLVAEINVIKGDFFESALMGLVRRGNPQAIVYANKTFNRQRGYGEKIEHEHTGTVSQQHIVQVEDLNMTLEQKKELLIKIRQQQQRIAGDIDPAKIVDVN